MILVTVLVVVVGLLVGLLVNIALMALTENSVWATTITWGLPVGLVGGAVVGWLARGTVGVPDWIYLPAIVAGAGGWLILNRINRVLSLVK